MNIGKAIIVLRKQKKVKQLNLAVKAGISQSYLSLVEHSVKQPSMEVIEKIASALGESIATLLFYALEETDIEPSKLDAFRALKPILYELLKAK